MISQKKLFVALAVASFLGMSARAEEAFQAPEKLELRAYENVSYNDNLFFDARGTEEQAAIFRTGARIDYERLQGRLQFRFKGNVESVNYPHYSRLDYIGYKFQPELSFEDGHSQYTLSGLFSHSYALVDNTNLDQYDIYTNALNGAWDYDIDELWGIKLDAQGTNKIYTNKSELNYNEVEAGLSPYYIIGGKTRVGVRGGGGARFYNEHTQQVDSDWIFANPFVDYEITNKLTSHVEAGYIYHRYDGGVETWNGFNALAQLNYKPTQKLGFDLTLSRKPTDSYNVTVQAEAKQQVKNEASLGMTWDMYNNFTLAQRIGYGLNDVKNGNLSNRPFSYQIKGIYKMGEHVELSAGYEYTYIHYTDIGHADVQQNILSAEIAWKF